jgi:hypothetical protein
VAIRQHERDVRFFAPIVANLSQQQVALLMMLHDVLARYRPTAVPRLTDRDVADAAGALASTYETAERGILYEHQPSGLHATRLSKDIQAFVERLTKELGAGVQAAAPAALRAMHTAAGSAASLDSGDCAYLDLIDRLIATPGDTADRGTGTRQLFEAPRLIVP